MHQRDNQILKALLPLILVAVIAGAQELPTKPEKALDYILLQARKALMESNDSEQFLSRRSNLARHYLQQNPSPDLNDTDRLAYAEIQRLAKQYEAALETLIPLQTEGNAHCRRAQAASIGILSTMENWSETEHAIARYMQTYPTADSSMESSIATPLRALALHYLDNEEHEAALQLWQKVRTRLDGAAPYRSYLLLTDIEPAFTAQEKKDQYQQQLKQTLDSVAAAKDAFQETMPEEPDGLQKMTARNWRYIHANLNSALTVSQLLGQPAPDLTFEHWIGSDSYESLSDLRGKVVMLDFWATWCKPCIMAFPSMRELYQEYRNRGFEIIGVTSYQGAFADENINEKEITRDREHELTARFRQNQEMTWPVTFTEQSVFNKDYGIFSIPTFVLLDQHGRIVMIESGLGDQTKERLKVKIEELLH